MKKTNAIRLLEQAGIDYEARMYPVDESDLSGTHAAAVLGLPAGQVFKTLVPVSYTHLTLPTICSV